MVWFGRRGGDYDPPLKKPANDNVASAVILPFPVKRHPDDQECDAVEVFKEVLAGLKPNETLVIYVVNEDDEPV
jgi:hypothetical protein